MFNQIYIFLKYILLDLKKKMIFYDYYYYKNNHFKTSNIIYDFFKNKISYIQSLYFKIIPKIINQNLGIDLNINASFPLSYHLTPMLSINNTYNQQAILKFYNNIKSSLKIKNIQSIIEPKIDGIAISAIFYLGKLIKIITRGNGIKGENISYNINFVINLPKIIRYDTKHILDLRGEIYIEKKEFIRINQIRKINNLLLYAHPRNLVVGTLKLINNTNAMLIRKLKIIFYSLGFINKYQWQINQFYICEKLRLMNNRLLFKKKYSLLEIWDSIQFMKYINYKFLFVIDGVVLKINSIYLQNQIGINLDTVKWIIAYKFAIFFFKSFIKQILFQLGNKGMITPIALINAIYISGSYIKRINIYNCLEIIKMDLRMLDQITIYKSGEIIPIIKDNHKEIRTYNIIPFIFPLLCHFCSDYIIISYKNPQIHFLCGNKHCIFNNRQKIRNEISLYKHINKHSFNFLSKLYILVNLKIVNTISDIYKLTYNIIFNINNISPELAFQFLYYLLAG